jgi:hypothetical protein
MGGDFDVLSPAQFTHGLEDLGLVEVKNEVNLLAVLEEVVALVGPAGKGFIKGEARTPQEKSLDVTGRRNFEGGAGGGQHQWAARLDFNPDVGGPGGRLLGFVRRRRVRAAQADSDGGEECEAEKR